MRLIGPHEGRELELLLSGEKPLAMLYHVYLWEDPYFDEDSFDIHVDKGSIHKAVRFYAFPGDHRIARYFFYYRPGERWRFLLLDYLKAVQRVVVARNDLWDDEIIGALLGYSSRAVQAFLRRIRRRWADVPWNDHDVSAVPKLHRPRREPPSSSKARTPMAGSGSLIGPHDGHELEMMLTGAKKLAVFRHRFEEEPSFDEARFDRQVERQRLFKMERHYSDGTQPRTARFVYYFAPGEQWRYLAAELLMRQAWIDCLVVGPWWDEVMGGLLSYPEEAVQAYIQKTYKSE